jgi:hypothetical protein
LNCAIGRDRRVVAAESDGHQGVESGVAGRMGRTGRMGRMDRMGSMGRMDRMGSTGRSRRRRHLPRLECNMDGGGVAADARRQRLPRGRWRWRTTLRCIA